MALEGDGGWRRVRWERALWEMLTGKKVVQKVRTEWEDF